MKSQMEIEVEKIAGELLQVGGSSMANLTFAARDLGFPEHTEIHDAAKRIIAKWAGWAVAYDRLNRRLEAETAPSVYGETR